MSAKSTEENDVGYFLLKENGRCGDRGARLSRDRSNTVGDCAALARGAGASAFSFGSRFRRGWCYVENMAVDAAKIAAWEANRASPTCDEGDGWISDRLYDLYVLEPLTT